ncbi:MAG: Dabb family protein [Saprospiraceae bacterium]|nr:Dabb family protein [Saprospiraceae bacterium]
MKNTKMIFPIVSKCVLSLALLLTFFLACKSDAEIAEPNLPSPLTIESGFVHAVYFYLNDSLDQQTKNDFSKVLDTLATIPSLKQVYYGPPANTPRRVVDNSYDYAFICVFDNKEGHDAYQNHPIHVAFKKRYTRLIEDVNIYDNVFGDSTGY